MTQFLQFSLVMAGGAFGAAGRYGLSLVLPKSFWPVTICNVLGSFLAVCLISTLLKGDEQANLRLLLITGFLGAFTTFSAFSVESLDMLQQNKHGLLAGYISLNVIGSLAAAFLALKIFSAQ
jgi:CrcB protein